MLGKDVRAGQDRRHTGERRKMSLIVGVERRAVDDRRMGDDRRNDS